MQMVLRWKEGVGEYRTKFRSIEIENPEKCERCGCVKFHKWGKYGRYVVEEDAEHWIFIQRICCVKCLKTYSYLPSFCVTGNYYSVDFILTFLSALILKIRFELDDMRRRAYAFLKRFRELENLWLVFLRAKGFGDFPKDKKERMVKIFTALLEYHKTGDLLASFFKETGRHFMSAK